MAAENRVIGASGASSLRTLEVAGPVLTAYRSRYSEKAFTQPHLLTVLCLMRHEHWTHREAEVRLGQHAQ